MSEDRHRVESDPDLQFVLRLDLDVPFSAVNSVCVIAFLEGSRIIAVKQRRGVDIPGGHVEVGELSVESTARREALEEAGVVLGRTKICGYLEPIAAHSSKSSTHYIGLVCAEVRELLPESCCEQGMKRLLLSPAEFLSQYPEQNRGLMGTILERCSKIICRDAGVTG